MAFAILLLLVPVICPVLYLWVVPSEHQPLGQSRGRRLHESETRKWALTTIVFASVVAALGLAIVNPYLAVIGMLAVVASAAMLIWCD
jgi:hypothetical protein